MPPALVRLIVLAIAFVYWAADYLDSKNPYVPSLPPVNVPIKILQDTYEEESTSSGLNCSIQHCSWLDYLGNADFDKKYTSSSVLYEEADIDIEASFSVDEVKLSCLPEKFGYSHEEADKLFPYIGYKTCEELGFREGVMNIDTSTNTLTLNCPTGTSAYYWVGFSASEEQLGQHKRVAQRHSYIGTVEVPNDVEIYFGSCSDEQKADSAAYVHRKKPDVVARVQADMQQNQRQAQFEHGESQTRPLTVLVLTLDSLSRRQFYRKLPKTTAFMNSINPEEFRVVDFVLHNVIGDNSNPNVIPIWTGYPVDKAQLNKTNKYKDLLGEASIWSYLRKNVRV